jgi:hypothetical protein
MEAMRIVLTMALGRAEYKQVPILYTTRDTLFLCSKTKTELRPVKAHPDHRDNTLLFHKISDDNELRVISKVVPLVRPAYLWKHHHLPVTSNGMSELAMQMEIDLSTAWPA